MKGIVGALLIFTIVYTHGAPFDKSELSSMIKDLQKEYNSRKEESHTWLGKLNNTKHELNADQLQSFLKNLRHRDEKSNGKRDSRKLPIPLNLLWLKNKSDSSDSDSDDDKSKLILSRRKNEGKNVSEKKNSSGQKSTEEKFDKSNSHDSSESNSRMKNSDESKHDSSESGSTWEETDSSDSSSIDKSENVQVRPDKYHLRDRKRKRDSRQHENYKHDNLWSDSNSDSESGEDEFKRYLQNVLQNKQNRKEIIQMLRNRNIEGQNNLSEAKIHYNKLYKLNRDKFLEWKKKIDVKAQLSSEKENLSVEGLKNICNISGETEENVEEDRIKQCVKNHMSMNDTFNIATDLSDILPSMSKNTTVQIHRDNDTKIIKVSIDVNKPLPNGDTLQIHIENEKSEEPNASTNRRKVTKVIKKEGRIVEISSSDNNQPLNNSISNVLPNSTPGQAETLEKSENEDTKSGGEQTSSNDNNSSGNVHNTIEKENSPVNGGDASENGNEQTKPNTSSQHGETIPDTEPEARKNFSSKTGTVFPEEGVSTSGNEETVNQGDNTLNNNEISSDDSNKGTDSSIVESTVLENEETTPAHDLQAEQLPEIEEGPASTEAAVDGSTRISSSVGITVEPNSSDSSEKTNVNESATLKNEQTSSSTQKTPLADGSVNAANSITDSIDESEQPNNDEQSDYDLNESVTSSVSQLEDSGITEVLATETPNPETTDNEHATYQTSSVVDDSEKSTSSASESESSSISESVASGIQHSSIPNSETESSDATAEQTTDVDRSTVVSERLSTPVPQSEDSVVTEEEDSGVTHTNSETTPADLNISESTSSKHRQEELPDTEEASESTESSNVIFVTDERQLVELTSSQSEITLSDDNIADISNSTLDSNENPNVRVNEQTESNDDWSTKPEEQTASFSETEESRVTEVEQVSEVSESETDSALEREIEENNTLNNNDISTGNIDEQTDSSIGESSTSVDSQRTSSSTKSSDLTETKSTESSNSDKKETGHENEKFNTPDDVNEPGNLNVNKTTWQTNQSSISVGKMDLPPSPTSNSSGTASTVGSQISELRINSSSLDENLTTVVRGDKLESDSTYNTVVSEAVSSVSTTEDPSSEPSVELLEVNI